MARREGVDFPRLIVHANDGSPPSLDAARVAGRIAARCGSRVITLNAADRSAAGIGEEAAALIGASGCEATVRTEVGPAHTRIVEVANDTDASLIVIGGRGRSGLAALGSVSERVVHTAPCSVLIVRAASHPVRDSDGEEPSLAQRTAGSSSG